MLLTDLPPGTVQYLGPAFSPVVAALWNVIGRPLFELCSLVWFGLTARGMNESFGQAVGGLLQVAFVGALLVGAVVCTALFLIVFVGVAFIARRQAR
ncbi:MAG: hypothetical protein JWO38_6606 [Gemmataceae bacterium]|nr:hypothetical protein [Gemmataceae bacterium]